MTKNLTTSWTEDKTAFEYINTVADQIFDRIFIALEGFSNIIEADFLPTSAEFLPKI